MGMVNSVEGFARKLFSSLGNRERMKESSLIMLLYMANTSNGQKLTIKWPIEIKHQDTHITLTSFRLTGRKQNEEPTTAKQRKDNAMEQQTGEINKYHFIQFN
jgi:hypothetical protein